MPDKVYVKLDDEHFKALVRGKEAIVRRGDVEVRIILADIGWDKMLLIVAQALRDAE